MTTYVPTKEIWACLLEGRISDEWPFECDGHCIYVTDDTGRKRVVVKAELINGVKYITAAYNSIDTMRLYEFFNDAHEYLADLGYQVHIPPAPQMQSDKWFTLASKHGQ